MDSSRGPAPLRAGGFPIRTSSGHSLVGGSPKLFAASHVLHRLRLPRHPPCALRSLVTSSSLRPSGLERVKHKASSLRYLPLSPLVKELRPARLQRSQIIASWWSRSGSNRRHPACKAGALPTELHPHELGDPSGYCPRFASLKERHPASRR